MGGTFSLVGGAPPQGGGGVKKIGLGLLPIEKNRGENSFLKKTSSAESAFLKKNVVSPNRRVFSKKTSSARIGESFLKKRRQPESVSFLKKRRRFDSMGGAQIALLPTYA